jgi:hypothetical protein
MTGTHAFFNASGFHRWGVCAASKVMEANEPDTQSIDAAYGTKAHSISESWLKRIPYVGNVPEEMTEYLSGYVARVRSRAENGELEVEKAMDISFLTGEEGAKGTADAFITSNAGKTQITIDLKFGMGHKVHAKDNLQMVFYMLAGMQEYSLISIPEKLVGVIDQPRINHLSVWETTPGELLKYVSIIKSAVDRVKEAQKSNSLTDFFNPGTEQCRFCKAKAKCPALANLVAKETGADFEDIEQKELINPVDSHKALLKVDMIEIWCRVQRAKVEADLLAGKPSDFWKIVEGKRGNRDWRDDDEAESLLHRMRLKSDEMYNKKLKSPTQILKELKDNPLKAEKIEELIVQRPGKPSVAPAGDPRPALILDPSADFTQIEGD